VRFLLLYAELSYNWIKEPHRTLQVYGTSGCWLLLTIMLLLWPRIIYILFLPTCCL